MNWFYKSRLRRVLYFKCELANLETIYKFLKSVDAVEYKTIDMKQGQKISRIVAWTFLTKQEQKDWK